MKKYVVYTFIFYLLLEALVYLLVCLHIVKPDPTFLDYKTLYAANKPYTTATKFGYRYMPGDVFLVNIQEGQVSTMHSMHVNNYGYPTSFDFNQKKDERTFRYLVFGDSYSAGEITDTTWVDFLQYMYSEKNQNYSIELYNCSLEAAGIQNWYLQFQDHVKFLDFDGVIFAVFGAEKYISMDLCRPLATKFIEDNQVKFSFTNVDDRSPTDELTQSIWSSNIYDDSTLNTYIKISLKGLQNVKYYYKKPQLYLAKTLTNVIHDKIKLDQFRKSFTQSKPPMFISDSFLPDSLTLEKYLPPTNYRMLEVMLNDFQKRQKKVFFVTIPNLELVKRYPNQCKLNLYNKQLSAYADKHGFVFWDGYQVFDSIKPEQLYLYHLTGDMHWNRQACFMFAKKLYESDLLLPERTYHKSSK